MSVRAQAAALALGTLLALLCAGEARAARVCSNTPGPDDRVDCGVASLLTLPIDIELTNQAITTSGTGHIGVWARHFGEGGITIRLRDTAIMTSGRLASGLRSLNNYSRNASPMTIDLAGGSISTTGEGAYGIIGHNRASTGIVDIDLAGGSISTAGVRAHGIWVLHGGSGGIDVDMAGGTISTTGEAAHGLVAQHYSVRGLSLRGHGQNRHRHDGRLHLRDGRSQLWHPGLSQRTDWLRLDDHGRDG